jgi:hypothetical protein
MIPYFTERTISPENQNQAGAEMLAFRKFEEKMAQDMPIPSEGQRIRERVLDVMKDGRERTASDLAHKLKPHSHKSIVGVLRYMVSAGMLKSEQHEGAQCMIYTLAAE